MTTSSTAINRAPDGTVLIRPEDGRSLARNSDTIPGPAWPPLNDWTDHFAISGA